MKAKFLSAVLIAVLVLGTALPVYAYGHSRGHGGYGKGDKAKIEKMFFHKAHFLLYAKDQIGLSEEQVKNITDLKLEMKKNYIRQKAEIKILEMDLRSQLKSDKPDPAAIDELIGQKYKTKETMAKSFVEAYLKLKNSLNDKQREAMKSFKQEKMKQFSGKDHGR